MNKPIKIEKESLRKVFERHPESGMAFFKGLAGAIGQRLIYSYNSFLSGQSPEREISYGAGRLMDAGMD